MTSLFDTSPDRRATHSIKWTLYDPDVIPLWVADMDFPAPAPIRAAIQTALEHGVLGYEFPSKALKETVAARMKRIHNWEVDPDWVLTTPGIIAGFNAAAKAVCAPSGAGILIQPPVYPPFFSVKDNLGIPQQVAPLAARLGPGNALAYEIDWHVFQSAIHSNGAKTGLFLLCNPHNPTGQVYSRADLQKMAELCLENEVVICADEIHNEHVLEGTHTPIAALSPAVAARTITLVAPSKTFNVPGLFCGFAIVPDPGLRQQFKKASEQMILHVSSLSLVAAQAAFNGACDDWLADLRGHIRANRDFLLETLARDFPAVRVTHPQSTYMAWADFSAYVESGQVSGAPNQFFLEKARVALSAGRDFGPGYENFTRIVYGCTRETLAEGLQRMKNSLA